MEISISSVQVSVFCPAFFLYRSAEKEICNLRRRNAVAVCLSGVSGGHSLVTCLSFRGRDAGALQRSNNAGKTTDTGRQSRTPRRQAHADADLRDCVQISVLPQNSVKIVAKISTKICSKIPKRPNHPQYRRVEQVYQGSSHTREPSRSHQEFQRPGSAKRSTRSSHSAAIRVEMRRASASVRWYS